MSKLLQIYEGDLAELEQILPALHDAMGKTSPRIRMKLRRAKQILSDVRWDYGPHSEVEEIPAPE